MGMVLVKFAFLDQELNTIGEIGPEPLRDGRITEPDAQGLVDWRNRKVYEIEEGYLKDYFEDQFNEVLETEKELSHAG
jgi:hypothetical protein